MDTSTQHPASTATSSSSFLTSDSEAGLASFIERVTNKVNDVGPEKHPRGECTIFKVPVHIRRLDRRAYKPVVVPIGPIHHVPSCETAIREHKWRCVRYLLSRYDPKNKSKRLYECLRAMKELDEGVRSCYSEKFQLNAHEMAEIMLLDGCFIIHLLLKHANKETQERCEMMGREKGEGEREGGVSNKVRGELGDMKVLEVFSSDKKMVRLETTDHDEEIEGPFVAGLFTVEVVLYDLLKLENQIPFFIIKTLSRLLKIPEVLDTDDLQKRVLDLFCNIQPLMSPSFSTASIDKPIHHLLHLFHSSRVSTRQKEKTNGVGGERIPSATELTRAGVSARQKEKGNGLGREWIPSATELRRAGVRFRRKEKEITNFLDITFDQGRMEIPPLQVTDNTCSIFRNLIAFEQCYADARTNVTAYAVFMDCIIDEAKDARLLHLKGIVVNRLSTDKALANLFNKLCNQVPFSHDKNYLAPLFKDVNTYYDSRFHKWRAGLMRDYFSSPWTIISVIAAGLLLLLTVGQALLAGFSYFHPL